ncbi:LysR family transcriptional regulator [Streptomyces tubbatahanensis]|uniref:LysR family transcriptional regulator n=1 Tax=Streptomyces tubbatahanensis TaxID=2923272 RepID=A0ABY3XNT0_9ACTN|nr:LysR family transcriptional regulator [Streptomyces tubbatahanensis]UNS96118.1 LysR family transcriptional regulator [Streptomyces tubbatahanensis]
MDLVGACRAFVQVSERGSFTAGAAAARMSQSVASRRVAALEQHVGERLFERSSRRARLTPFGRSLLPSARRLVLAAEELEHEAATAHQRPVSLAVPDTCPTPGLARLAAAARSLGLVLDPRTAAPAERPHLVRSQQVRAALVAVPPDQARWSVPLGLAAVAEPAARRLFLESLRPRRTRRGRPRRVWVQPEDDVPHVRDRLTRLGDSVGLLPAQVSVAASLTQAAAQVLSGDDLLLCSPVQAQEFALHWRPLGELDMERTYGLLAAEEGDAERLGDRLGDALAHCLGAGEEPAEAGAAHRRPAADRTRRGGPPHSRGTPPE